MKTYYGSFNKLIFSRYSFLYAIGKNHFHSIVSNNLGGRINKINSINSLSLKNFSSVDLKKDYYSTLGIKPNASQKEIREAYLNLAKKHHPDITKKSESADYFKEISNSFQILSNEKTKKFYDENSSGFHRTNNAKYENDEHYKPRETPYYRSSYEDFFEEQRRKKYYEKKREEYNYRHRNSDNHQYHYRQASVKVSERKTYDFEKHSKILNIAFFIPKFFMFFTLYMLYKYIDSKIRMILI